MGMDEGRLFTGVSDTAHNAVGIIDHTHNARDRFRTSLRLFARLTTAAITAEFMLYAPARLPRRRLPKSRGLHTGWGVFFTTFRHVSQPSVNGSQMVYRP